MVHSLVIGFSLHPPLAEEKREDKREEDHRKKKKKEIASLFHL